VQIDSTSEWGAEGSIWNEDEEEISRRLEKTV
jgi:hypothetical protein